MRSIFYPLKLSPVVLTWPLRTITNLYTASSFTEGINIDCPPLHLVVRECEPELVDGSQFQQKDSRRGRQRLP
jgi:hypothetical protein